MYVTKTCNLKTSKESEMKSHKETDHPSDNEGKVCAEFIAELIIHEVIKEAGKCKYCGKIYQRLGMLKKRIEIYSSREWEG